MYGTVDVGYFYMTFSDFVHDTHLQKFLQLNTIVQ
jgi:hypothetical protein